jgi:TrmH family RNA methyltransferase
MAQITSLQNPLIKYVLQLQDKARDRKRDGAFVIEGGKEIKMAMDNGYEIKNVLTPVSIHADMPVQTDSTQVSDEVFQKISYRGLSAGAVAIARQKEHPLAALSLSEHPLILVAEGIEKPGNLGAMLRTADAAGIDAVICCGLKTDLYNPNVIRSSVGCFFTVQIASASKEECVRFLKEKNIRIYTASLKAAASYLEMDYKKASAFVFGSEATGVDAFWEENSDSNIIIPMRGQNDSLNVSVTAAILLFEAVRQRG